MIPTTTTVYAAVRSYLGDDEVSGGDLYTDAVLLPHLQSAVNTLFRCLTRSESPLTERTCYYNLPAGQSYLDLDTAGMGDVAEMLSIRAKTVESSGAIEDLVWNAGTSAWRVASTAHGLSSDNLVYLYGVTDGADEFVNADWRITVINADNFDLRGSPNKTAATATYDSVAATGRWVFATATDWGYPMNQVDGVQDINDSGLGFRQAYDFRQGALRLQPDLAAARLLEIKYRIEPNNIVSTAPNLRVRNSQDFLARMTAGLAALQKGAAESAAMNLAIAMGSASLADLDEGNPGGLLGSLAQRETTASRQVVQTQRYRARRYSRGRY